MEEDARSVLRASRSRLTAQRRRGLLSDGHAPTAETDGPACGGWDDGIAVFGGNAIAAAAAGRLSSARLLERGEARLFRRRHRDGTRRATAVPVIDDDAVSVHLAGLVESRFVGSAGRAGPALQCHPCGLARTWRCTVHADGASVGRAATARAAAEPDARGRQARKRTTQRQPARLDCRVPIRRTPVRGVSSIGSGCSGSPGASGRPAGSCCTSDSCNVAGPRCASRAYRRAGSCRLASVRRCPRAGRDSSRTLIRACASGALHSSSRAVGVA
jgi:hypothetical protein